MSSHDTLCSSAGAPDALAGNPDVHEYDDMCEWVGRVRLLTWTLRTGDTNDTLDRFILVVRAGQEVTVDVLLDHADYTVTAHVERVRTLWGAPSFRTLREAQSVVRELHDLVREVKLRVQATASPQVTSVVSPIARATVTFSKVCELLGDILHHGVIDQPDIKIGVRPFMSAITVQGLPSSSTVIDHSILATFSRARAAVDELVRQREFGLRNAPRCGRDEQGACDCYDFDALRVLWPGQETSAALTEPANGAR